MTQTALERLYAEFAKKAAASQAWSSHDDELSFRFYTSEATLRSHPAGFIAAADRYTQWARSVLALDRYVSEQGTLPVENNRKPQRPEQSLTNWVRTQRKAHALGRLSSYQARRLLCIPGFSFSPLDDRWRALYLAFSSFTETHGYAPRLRSDSLAERTLAAWASKQRLLFRQGSLSAARKDALNQLAFWAWGPRG